MPPKDLVIDEITGLSFSVDGGKTWKDMPGCVSDIELSAENIPNDQIYVPKAGIPPWKRTSGTLGTFTFHFANNWRKMHHLPMKRRG